MAQQRTSTEARQGETGRSMLVVMVVSTVVAAAIAIAAYIFVFATPNDQLDNSIPSTATATDPAAPAATGAGTAATNATGGPDQPAGGTPATVGQ